MDNNLKLEAEKHFSREKERVFEAWIESEQLKKWWKPMDNALTEVNNDLKPGGTVTISGNYEEVVMNEKLVYSWNWEFAKDEIKNASYKLDVQFITQGEGSSIHMLQTSFENEESIVPHKEGWEKGLNDLAAYLDDNSD